MTEQEWLGCTDPEPMLRFLQERQTSDRKLRLLACACCRQVWHLLSDPLSRKAVLVVERYADGQASDTELSRARWQAAKPAGEGDRQAAWAPYWATTNKPAGPLWNTFTSAAEALARQAAQVEHGKRAAAYEAMQSITRSAQAKLIREVIGNPFRPAIIDPRWRTWGGGIVVQLAEGIYEDRAFATLPVFGDALEEAGCTDDAILQHCRQTDEHVRGCWVVDLLLDRS
jgi:hypothetical protein